MTSQSRDNSKLIMTLSSQSNQQQIKRLKYSRQTSQPQAYGPTFFWGGGAPSLPENFFDSARKTAMLTCKITLPDSPHPIIVISLYPGFRALYLARRNESRFFA